LCRENPVGGRDPAGRQGIVDDKRVGGKRGLMTASLVLFSLFSFVAEANTETDENRQYAIQHSLGMSEKLGPFGLYNATFSLKEESNEYFVVVGSTVIIFGGAGIGWKHIYLDKIISPYTCITAYGIYTLPAMCTNCTGIAMDAYISGSLGVELRLFKAKTYSSHVQIGVFSAYSLSDMSVFESPSDRPLIWPVINLKISREIEG
jgi:hypothetical protein